MDMFMLEEKFNMTSGERFIELVKFSFFWLYTFFKPSMIEKVLL
jgi:hypothetical protein